jgi:hypothetical protein
MTPTSVVMPPGGASSTHVAHSVGFFREGRKPNGRTNRPPMPANGAPHIPHRGLDGSARMTLCTARVLVTVENSK